MNYRAWAEKFRRKATEKRAVAARHAVGTAYHTRAILEAQSYETRAAEYEARAEEQTR